MIRHGIQAVIDSRQERTESGQVPERQVFEEPHYPISYWARLWGFSSKTVREWFRDEYGPGILRQANTNRRAKRDYTTITISTSAAARVYGKHSQSYGLSGLSPR